MRPESATTTIEDAWPAPLVRLLERQHAIAAELGELAARQPALIEDARTDELLDLLARREVLLKRFQATQDRLGELTTDLESRLETVEEPVRVHVRTLLDGIETALASVIERDAADQASLEVRRDETGRDLRGLDSTRRARSAYTGSGGSRDPRFADRRG